MTDASKEIYAAMIHLVRCPSCQREFMIKGENCPECWRIAEAIRAEKDRA